MSHMFIIVYNILFGKLVNNIKKDSLQDSVIRKYIF